MTKNFIKTHKNPGFSPGFPQFSSFYKEKPSFKIGKAAHMYLLEGRKEFEKVYWHNPYSEFKKDDLVKKLQELGYDDSIKKFLVTDLMEMLFDRKLSKEEKEILVKYAKSNGARKVEPYINALIQNGGYLQILEDAKKKESTASQNTINTDLSKVHNLKTACAFIGKYGDFTDCNHPKEVQEVMKQYEIESYTHAVEIQRTL